MCYDFASCAKDVHVRSYAFPSVDQVAKEFVFFDLAFQWKYRHDVGLIDINL